MINHVCNMQHAETVATKSFQVLTFHCLVQHFICPCGLLCWQKLRNPTVPWGHCTPHQAQGPLRARRRSQRQGCEKLLLQQTEHSWIVEDGCRHICKVIWYPYVLAAPRTRTDSPDAEMIIFSIIFDRLKQDWRCKATNVPTFANWRHKHSRLPWPQMTATPRNATVKGH